MPSKSNNITTSFLYSHSWNMFPYFRMKTINTTQVSSSDRKRKLPKTIKPKYNAESQENNYYDCKYHQYERESTISIKHIRLIVNLQVSNEHYLTRKFLFLDNEI